MLDDPSARGGMDESLAHSSSQGTGARPPLRASVHSSRYSWGRRVGYSLLLSLVLLMNVLSNMPVAQAVSHAPTKLPISNANYTLQQFLKQGHPYQAKDAPLMGSQSTPTPPRGVSLPTKTSQTLPSAQPPTMKATRQPISASFLQAPLVPSSLDPTITGTAGSTPSLHIVGSDADGVRLEVIVPPGPLDLSKATTTKGTAPQTPLILSVTQLSGHFVGMTSEL